MTDPRNEMDVEPVVFDVEDEAGIEAATLHGLADIEAGRVISHKAVKRWLLSLSTDNPLPRPKCGE